MAFDKSVTIESILPQGPGQTLTCRLQCWPKGTVSPTPENAVVDELRSAYVKGSVGGKTDQDLVDEAIADIKDELVEYLERFAIAQERGDLVVLSQITDELPE